MQCYIDRMLRPKALIIRLWLAQ